MIRLDISYYAVDDQNPTARPLFKYVLRSTPSPQHGRIRVNFLPLGPTNQPGALPEGFNDVVTEDVEKAFLGTAARLNSHHYGLRVVMRFVDDDRE